jgi:hypothetical protein
VIALLTALAAAPARADPPAPERPAAPSADELFEEGRRLMEAGQIGAACARFATSQRLDPAGGTLLNLALCHELEGQLTVAWTEFGEALAWARRDGQREREQLALQHLATLEGRIALLIVTVAPGAGELTVTVDGAPVAPTRLGQPLPRAPGPVRVEAAAPGAIRWARPLVLLAGQRVTLRVPALEREVAAAPAPAPARSWWGPRRIGATVTSGVAVALLAVGAGYGIQAISRSSAANARCTSSSPCSDRDALRWNRQARDYALVADVTLAVGLVAAGVATWLWITSRERPAAAPRRLAVAPVVGPGGGGLSLGGAW